MNARLLIVALLGLSCIAQAADTPGSSPNVVLPTVQERLAVARKALEAKEWNAAMRELGTALREAPQNADVHNLLGYSYRKRARPDMGKAIEHYQKALRLDPRHKGAHAYIGEAYLMEKRPQQAEQHLAELERICGNRTCEEYQDLAKSIADYKAKN